MVTNAKNVIIAQNIFCQGYIRGSGVNFFHKDNDTRNLGDRVKHYDPQGGEHTASLISVVIPYGTGSRLPNPLDIEAHKPYDYKKWQHRAQRIQQTEPNGVKDAAYMDAAYVSDLFNLHQYSRNRQDPASEPFVEFEQTQNTIVFRGHQFSYCPTTKQHTAVTINTGHWGPNVYPGCGRVRAGEMKYLQQCDYRSAVSVAR